MTTRVGVVNAGGDAAAAADLARSLQLPLSGENTDLLLVLTPERLELRETASRAGPVYADFSELRRRHGKREAVARAVGVKGAFRPRVLDATAGLGGDAFVLAAEGCRVTLVERSGVVAALLADGLRRALRDPATAAVAARMSLVPGEARAVLLGLDPAERPDTVYLDPMYPEGKTALSRKEMRFFRRLVGDDADAGELLETALEVARRRVVVKRPAKAGFLGDKPSATLPGKTTRFDLYLV